MPTRADEIRTRQASIRTDLDALETQLASDTVDNVDELQTRSDVLLSEWDELTTELEPLTERENRIAQVRATMQSEQNRENGFGAPDVHVRNDRDPFEDLDSVRLGNVRPGEVRARSLAAIERFSKRNDSWHMDDGAAEQATRLVEAAEGVHARNLGEHILTTGSPEYLAHFSNWLRDPQAYSQRAAMALSPSTAGGYLVPFTLDPTIILTNSGSANPYRQVSNIKTTTTNTWNGVTSAGVNAEWSAEGAEAADASPVVGPLQITPQKADAFVFGSDEFIGDSDFAQQLPTLMSDAKDRIEETAFAVGTGTGQPNGVVPRGTVLAAASGTAATGPGQADVYNLQAALPARWRGPTARNVWLANLATINRLRQVPQFSGAQVPLLVDTASGPQVLGKPLLESTSIVGAFANGNKVLVYLDGLQFYIVDRIGVSMIFEPFIIGTNRRPTGQSGWYMYWRVGSDVSTTNAVRVLSLTT